MNILKGKIDSVNENGQLSLVKVSVGKLTFTAIVIDTPGSAPYLSSGNDVNVIFKETEVIISTGQRPQISLQNKIPGIVHSIESGELLSKLVLETEVGRIKSIITHRAVSQLELEVGSKVVAMIKTNEIMLSND